MLAGGANCRGFCAFVNVTAVAAMPQRGGVLLEYYAVFDVFGKLVVTLFVLILYLAYFFKLLGKLFKPSSRAVSANSLYMVVHS